MAFAPKVVCLILLAAVSLFLQTQAQGVPRPRCQCPGSINAYHLKKVAEFSVFSPKFGCDTVEIILNLTSGKRVCLNPDKRQGKFLQQCWTRRNKEQRLTLKVLECFRERSAEPSSVMMEYV